MPKENPNVGVVFGTGRAASLGEDICSDIRGQMETQIQSRPPTPLGMSCCSRDAIGFRFRFAVWVAAELCRYEFGRRGLVFRHFQRGASSNY